MKWIVFAVGLLTAVFGVWWSWDGYNIVLVERGWAKHIAGSVFFGAGLLTMATAALMHKVQQLANVVADTRRSPPAYAPPPVPRDLPQDPPHAAPHAAPNAAPELRYEPPAAIPMPAPMAAPMPAPTPGPMPAPTAATASAIPTGAAATAVATSLPALTREAPDAPDQPAAKEDDDMLAAVGAALAAEPPSSPGPEPQQEAAPEPLPLRPAAPFAPKLPEAREPFVFRPPPPLPRSGEATLDFSMPPSEHRPAFGRGFGEPPNTPAPEAAPEPAAAPAAAAPAEEEAQDAPEVTVAPPPSEAPKLDHLFDDLPPEPPKPVEEPQRRRSSFDWLSTARRRAEPPAPVPAEPIASDPEPVVEAREEPEPARADDAREEPARDREATPDITEELVEAPVGADDGDARLVRRYESQGVKYSLYEDGSIRAESERGVFKFGSLAELRGFLEKGG